MTADRTRTPTAGTGPDNDPRLVRLRRQLMAREQVVKQLNRRLVELEREAPVPERTSHDGTEAAGRRIAVLEAALREERYTRRVVEERLQLFSEELERLRNAPTGDGDHPRGWAYQLRRTRIRRSGASIR